MEDADNRPAVVGQVEPSVGRFEAEQRALAESIRSVLEHNGECSVGLEQLQRAGFPPPGFDEKERAAWNVGTLARLTLWASANGLRLRDADMRQWAAVFVRA